MHTHYKTLGVAPNASATDIQSAYRRAAMRWHPDRNPANLAEAERNFKELGAAYAVLSDVARRKDYDAELERLARGGAARESRFEDEVNAEAAAAIFLRAMMEMSASMALAGHNRDVIFGALLSQGCPEALARRIAEDTMQAIARAKAEEARQAKEAQAEARREAARQKEAAARRKAEDAEKTPATSAKASSTLSWVLGSVIAVLIVAWVLGNFHSDSNPRPVSVDIAAHPAVPVPSVLNDRIPAPTKYFKLAVAAKSANIRKGPSAKTGVAVVVNRGEALSEVRRETGFVQVELEDGRSGWISDQLVIDRSRAKALSEITAIQYGLTSSRSSGLEKYLREVSEKDYGGRVRATFTAAASDPTRLNRDLHDIVLSMQLPSYFGADVDAKKWWALEAKWLSDNGANPSDELAAALAAAQADPTDVDGLMAVGIASIKAEAWDILFSRLAYTLPILAPSSTNTWVIVAAWAAQRGDKKLAASALSLAISKSKNPAVTKAYLANVAAKSAEPLVAAAFQLGSNASEAVSATATSTGAVAVVPVSVTNGSTAVSGTDMSCSGMSRYAPKYEERMATLVQTAGGYAVSPGYSMLTVELVTALCQGDRSRAIAMVKERRIDGQFADKVRQLLTPNMSSLLYP